MTDLEQAAQKVVRQLRADPGWAPHQLALVLRRATVILELEAATPAFEPHRGFHLTEGRLQGRETPRSACPLSSSVLIPADVAQVAFQVSGRA